MNMVNNSSYRSHQGGEVVFHSLCAFLFSLILIFYRVDVYAELMITPGNIIRRVATAPFTEG